MAQVIIVSNRLPVSVKKENGRLVFSQSLGGLATGLSSYVKDRRSSLWIGWPGIASDGLTDTEKQIITDELAKQSYFPVFLTQKQVDYFYNGYSNSLLWPVFHGLPVRSDDSVQAKDWWKVYQAVNKQFAEAVINLSDPKSRIWVHDYQLILLPGMIKSRQSSSHVGFFLHIPFPLAKQFNRLDESKKLLGGMLAADLVGFHTSSYLQNFTKSVSLMDAGEVNERGVLVGDHLARLAEFPMGIDYERFAEANKLSNVKAAVKEYKKKYRGLKIIVSVDRLDPSKGLVERLKAYQQFLEEYPKSVGKVIFVMVAAPSRTDLTDYKNLSQRLTKLAGEINQTYSTSGWQAVDYINKTIPFEEVSALFQIADVAFIAPLRDGMNLAAKEFVASNKGDGVLILSETAGAAEELKDALIVDPRKPKTYVDALNQALNMRRRELRSRIKRMRKDLSTHTVQDWAKNFIETLQQPLPGAPRLTRTFNQHLQKKMIQEYRQAERRLLLLDYDGSLVPFIKNFGEATPPKSLLKLLESLSAVITNDVIVISGRGAEELEAWFGKLPINLVAEHGASIKQVGEPWQAIQKTDTAWKQLLLPPLEKYAKLTPGARVEVKPHSLVWHYRAASTYYAQKNIVIIKRALGPILKKEGLEILQGNKILEIKNPKVSKGAAAKPWVEANYDFILAIGDDATDEELFSVLPATAYSVKVGRGLTRARFRLPSYKEILVLLKKLR